MTFPASHEIRYLAPEWGPLVLFALVKEAYGTMAGEPLPDYSKEDDGAIRGLLETIQNDDYYPDFLDKAAHLFCHIVTTHIFSNGNKRLGFVTLLIFVNFNGFYLEEGKGSALADLAVELADKENSGLTGYDQAKERVRQFLAGSLVAREPDSSL